MQQEIAVARRASGFDAHVFGSVVLQGGVDFFIGWPIDVGGISVFHDDTPFIHRLRRLHLRRAFARRSHPRPSIDEGARIGGVLQNRRYGRDRRPRPAEIAAPVATRQIETSIVEHTHDLGGGAPLQKQLEHKTETFLNRYIGILDDDTGWIAGQTYRQIERRKRSWTSASTSR
jgi:hypothetical protein